jgi:hypothetical protein
VLSHDLPCARWVHAATTAASGSTGLATQNHGAVFISDLKHSRQSSAEKIYLHATCKSCNVPSHELPDPDERLLRQHVLLLRARSFWHTGLIDQF